MLTTYTDEMVCTRPAALLFFLFARLPLYAAQVVLLGTGNPNAVPERMGPATAIVVNGQAYLVDAGTGVVRRGAEAVRKGVAALAANKLDKLFLTHLHSDHTLGLADVILTPAVAGRKNPLEIHGPPGTAAMTRHLLAAYKEDIAIRLHGGEPARQESYVVHPHDDHPGKVYEDGNVKVFAFPVNHGAWKSAYGYRFETADGMTIVVSGDTTYSESLVRNAKGCDILVHEVYSAKGLTNRTPDWQKYHSTFHTSGVDVGRIAAQVQPKLLVLYHQLPFGETIDELLDEVRRNYQGKVVSGKDLDILP